MTLAVRYGAICYLDEVVEARQDTTVVIHPLTDARRDMIIYLVITLAVLAAVIMLGLAKGGFASVGTTATPLLALYLPPLEAAALLLPILISQDLISIYVYRRDWDASNLKILLPGAVIGMAFGWLIASHNWATKFSILTISKSNGRASVPGRARS